MRADGVERERGAGVAGRDAKDPCGDEDDDVAAIGAVAIVARIGAVTIDDGTPALAEAIAAGGADLLGATTVLAWPFVWPLEVPFVPALGRELAELAALGTEEVARTGGRATGLLGGYGFP